MRGDRRVINFQFNDLLGGQVDKSSFSTIWHHNKTN